jgi:hypothetical protein
VKVWSVRAVVSEKPVVCVTPEPVALIVVLVVAAAMLAAVEIVITVDLGFVPSIVTGVWLNLQVAPVGIPVQLGVIGWFIPLIGVKVSVIPAESCPAITVVVVGAASIEKSGAITVTTAADEVDELCAASPTKVAVTLFVPPGRAVVARVAVPVGTAGFCKLRSAVPRSVVTPLFRVEKLTVPVLVAGVTVAVKVTLVPTWTLVAEGVIAVVEAIREAAQCVNNVFMLIEPRPVTKS